jgi:hypothetical protein
MASYSTRTVSIEQSLQRVGARRSIIEKIERARLVSAWEAMQPLFLRDAASWLTMVVPL